MSRSSNTERARTSRGVHTVRSAACDWPHGRRAGGAARSTGALDSPRLGCTPDASYTSLCWAGSLGRSVDGILSRARASVARGVAGPVFCPNGSFAPLAGQLTNGKRLFSFPFPTSYLQLVRGSPVDLVCDLLVPLCLSTNYRLPCRSFLAGATFFTPLASCF